MAKIGETRPYALARLNDWNPLTDGQSRGANNGHSTLIQPN